jgi:hypothetical protein
MFDLFSLVLDSGAPYHGDGVFVCESEEHRSAIIAKVVATGHEAFPVPALKKRRRMTERELHVVASAMDFEKRGIL